MGKKKNQDSNQGNKEPDFITLHFTAFYAIL